MMPPLRNTGPQPSVESSTTDDLSAADLDAIHDLMLASFDGDFSDEDWTHTIGGMHFFVRVDGDVVSHASVVPRVLEVDGQGLRCGYVEGVGTAPQHRHRGFGSAVVRAAAQHIEQVYEMGALGTDVFEFYELLGWERWRGPTFVRTKNGPVHSKDDDGYVMVLRFGPSGDVDLTSPISCDERAGDDW